MVGGDKNPPNTLDTPTVGPTTATAVDGVPNVSDGPSDIMNADSAKNYPVDHKTPGVSVWPTTLTPEAAIPNNNAWPNPSTLFGSTPNVTAWQNSAHGNVWPKSNVDFPSVPYTTPSVNPTIYPPSPPYISSADVLHPPRTMSPNRS